MQGGVEGLGVEGSPLIKHGANGLYNQSHTLK